MMKRPSRFLFALSIAAAVYISAAAAPAAAQNLTAGQIRLLPQSLPTCPTGRACIFSNSGNQNRVSFLDTSGNLVAAGESARLRLLSGPPLGYQSGDVWYDTTSKRLVVVQDGTPVGFVSSGSPVPSGTITGTYALGGSPSLAANLNAAGFNIGTAGTITAAAFVGGGAGLTNLAGAQVVGPIPLASVPAHASTHFIGGSDPIPVATTSSPGQMSAADKMKLDGIASGATATPLSSSLPLVDGTAAAGAATDASRSDHVHPAPSGSAALVMATHPTMASSATLRTLSIEHLPTSTSASADISSDVDVNGGGAFADLLTVSYTKLSAATALRVELTACGQNTAAGGSINYFRITVDGTAHGGGAFTTAVTGGTGCVTIAKRITGLAAGSRSIKAQWRTTASQLRIYQSTNPDGDHANLSVQELP